jgi:hypothetical protein
VAQADIASVAFPYSTKRRVFDERSGLCISPSNAGDLEPGQDAFLVVMHFLA